MLPLLVSLMLASVADPSGPSAEDRASTSAQAAAGSGTAEVELAGAPERDRVAPSGFGDRLHRRSRSVRALAVRRQDALRRHAERSRRSSDAGDGALALRIVEVARLELSSGSRGPRARRHRRSSGAVEPRGPTAEEPGPAGPALCPRLRFELDRSAPPVALPFGPFDPLA